MKSKKGSGARQHAILLCENVCLTLKASDNCEWGPRHGIECIAAYRQIGNSAVAFWKREFGARQGNSCHVRIIV